MHACMSQHRMWHRRGSAVMSGPSAGPMSTDAAQGGPKLTAALKPFEACRVIMLLVYTVPQWCLMRNAWVILAKKMSSSLSVLHHLHDDTRIPSQSSWGIMTHGEATSILCPQDRHISRALNRSNSCCTSLPISTVA